MIFGTTPITTQRLRGDRVIAEDLEPWSAIFLNEELAGAGCPQDLRTPERALEIHDADRAHWARFGFGPWSLRERQTNDYVGRIGLSYTRDGGSPEVELSWQLVVSPYSNEYALEAGREAIRVAFQVLELDGLITFLPEDDDDCALVAGEFGFEPARELERHGRSQLLSRLDVGRD